ncbi:hypothetical protein CALVIDRAFT_562868 [Calocera viscosa TUFC12733]|uniref:Uncharacterized protein n=1 Tax=Calocera viscosa (strain TUFC12733) TaxID=1330018 RepID=A0A167NAC3_CALVF|nr:hypothetical protein CALVIDRAFT_562868 [Calocera viscosa TUFC12733]
MFTIRTLQRMTPHSARFLTTTTRTLAVHEHRANKNEKPSSHSAGTDTQGDVHSAGKAAGKGDSPVGLDSAAQSKGGRSTGQDHKQNPSAGVGMKDQVGGSGKKGASHVGPKGSA